jgi:PEGA domain/Peptidoglycan-synthase activator LpoB
MRQILSLLFLPLLLWAKTPLVAVSDLNPRGIAANDASIITDRLRAELLQTGKVRVLERAEMDKILKEQAFQNSGACDQSQCAVEMGKLLAVDRMMVGSVGRIGTLYTLSARILDVRTGEVLFTATQDNEGRLEDLLVQTVPAIAAKLSVGATMASGTGAGPLGFGDLFVTVEDTAATLTLDGKPVPGRSPFSIEHVETGSHRLVARAGDRIGSIAIDLSKDDLQRFEIPLSQGSTSMKFFSEPVGAMVHLEQNAGSGQSLGVTPLKLDTIEAGNHQVTFSKFGYLDTTVSFVALMEKSGTLRVRLIPAGTLVLEPAPLVPVLLVRGRDTLRVPGRARIDLPPGTWRFSLHDKAWEPISTTVRIAQGRDDTIALQRHFARIEISTGIPAQVRLDGRLVGTSPLSIDSLEPGKHVVQASAEGHRELIQELTLSAGQTQHLDAQLESRFAWLRLQTPVAAQVELDGRPVGSTVKPPLNVNTHRDEVLQWNSDTLTPGLHRLRVVADRRVPWDDTVNLAPGTTLTYPVDLPWTPEELAHRRRATRLGYRTLLGVVTAGTAVATATFAYLWQDHASKARDIQSQYDASRSDFASYKKRYDQERSDANGSLRATAISGALAALAATGFVLSWNF